MRHHSGVPFRSRNPAIATLCLTAILASAGVARSSADLHVQGTGIDASGQSFTFDASSGPNGENPTGTMSFSGLAGQFTTPVTCLQVAGKQAVITAHPPLSNGNAANFLIEDNGSPGAGVDRFSALFGSALCEVLPITDPDMLSLFDAMRPIGSGEIIVAAQEPASADLAIASNTASLKHAKVGSEVTFTIIAANNGPDAAELNVMWASDQMQLVSETCDRGISADTPSCEYGIVEPGQTRTSIVVAEIVGTDGKHALSTACVSEQSGLIDDPRPENNCAAATVKVAGPR